ncbi:lipocalin/fatty-acid binding family protein [Streptomyces sp. NPDC057939]|uniref:lipocalin/fatty-acid binding family protein n=1 Tax=Streptomyces sp. NPDC057939 TaxID=3346284 RepID=UPI0036F10091
MSGSGAFLNVTGTYGLTSSEGYEEYLESIGVDPADRKAMASSRQTVEIKQEGDHYTLTTTTPARTHVEQFTLGQEYVATYDDGRPYKGICRRDGNRVIQQLKVGDFESTIVRQFADDGFEIMLRGADTDAKRTYGRPGPG